MNRLPEASSLPRPPSEGPRALESTYCLSFRPHSIGNEILRTKHLSHKIMTTEVICITSKLILRQVPKAALITRSTHSGGADCSQNYLEAQYECSGRTTIGREFSEEGRLREPHRHDYRVVRLLYLQHRSGARFSPPVLPWLRPDNRTLLAFSTFAAGFVARPIGGAIVFGHFGDRAGRKPMMVLTILIMGGIATVAIGLLPTYDSIGVFAPILLVVLRLTQGFALGGESGGAVQY